jgi:hypothetical protein
MSMTDVIVSLIRALMLLGVRNTLSYLVLCIALPVLVQETRTAALLAWQSAQTTGTVLATPVTTTTGKWGRVITYYHVEYAFQTEAGITVTGSQRLDRRDWDRARQDGTVPVQYVLSNPAVSAMRPPDPVLYATVVPIVLALLVWGLNRGLRILRFSLQAQRLLARPVWRSAQVTRIAPAPWWAWHSGYLEWRDAAGQTGQSLVVRLRAGLPQPGQAIRVLVDPWTGHTRWEGET